MNPDPQPELQDRRLARAEEKVRILERMLEDKTRSLYTANIDLERAMRYAHTLLDTAPVGFLVADSEGKIERVNTTLTNLFGYREDELLGRSVDVLVPESRRRAHGAQVAGFVANGATRAMGTTRYVTGRHRDGHEMLISVSLATVKSGDRSVVLAAIVDRTKELDAEREVRKIEREMAHLSGRSEVATGVLHNVGNVVNSVGVSANTIDATVRRSSLGLLKKIVELLAEHTEDAESLHAFLTEDSRGKLLGKSLDVIVERLEREQGDMRREASALQSQVEHIMAIIGSQQAFARAVGASTEIEIDAFLDKAITLSGAAPRGHQIRLERSYAELPAVTVDVHKLMQIVVNLLSNARHALLDHDISDPRIELRARRDSEGAVMISVSDNGIGITEERMSKIFDSGFTTKKNGRGYGLYSSMTAAAELGAVLTAKSDGPGKGATFEITLPVAGEGT